MKLNYQIDKFENIKAFTSDLLKQIDSDIISLKNKEIELHGAIVNIANFLKKIINSKKFEGILILINEADCPKNKVQL